MLLRAVLLFPCLVGMLSSFAMLIGCLKAMKGIHWLIYVVEGVSANSPVTQNCSAITFHYLSQTNGGIGIGMEWNRNGGGETIEMWWSDGKITTISFPGFSPTRPYRTRERRTWLGLVMCLPESGRLQMSDFGEEQISARFVSLSNIQYIDTFKRSSTYLDFPFNIGSIINEHKLLSPFQCGFRSNHSTEFAAAAFSDFIRRGMYQGLLTGAVFIDLRKAFDSVDHDLLNRMDSGTVN